MTSELITLTDTSDGFSTALIARGPGTGINRMQLTLRNEAAISAYGYREAIADFPDAVDEADLHTKATAHLAEVSDPAKHQELTVRVTGGPQFALGQRIRVSDGELGFTTTAKITAIDSDDASTTLTLGDAPASLLDVINKRDAEERRQIALGLPPPTNVEIIPAPTGLTVLASVGLNSRAVGLEVHVSASNGFIPDRTTLAARGPGSRFEIEGLPTAIRQFVRLRAYDDRGNFSPFTDQLSAAPRGVGTAELVVGQIDITNAERANAALSVKTSAGVEVLRLGNVSGKAGVPAGSQYGLWGAFGAGVWLENLPQITGIVVSTMTVAATSAVTGLTAGTAVSTGSVLGAELDITDLAIPPVPPGYAQAVLPITFGVTARFLPSGGGQVALALSSYNAYVEGYAPAPINSWSWWQRGVPAGTPGFTKLRAVLSGTAIPIVNRAGAGNVEIQATVAAILVRVPNTTFKS